MKKLFTTLALSGAVALGAHAQNSFVQPIIIAAPAEINCTDSFEFGWALVNHGPAAITTTDTFGFNDFENEDETSGWIGYVTEDVAVGDTFFVNLWNSHYDRVGWVVDAEDNILSGGGFPNGSYAFFVQFFGFYTFDGSAWGPHPTRTATDPDETDAVRSIAGIMMDINCPTSVEINGLDKHAITVYPNPTSGELNFSQSFNNTTDASVNIYDITGKVVMTKNFGTQYAGTTNFQVNVNNLPAGNYTLEFVTNENRGVSKFTVSK